MKPNERKDVGPPTLEDFRTIASDAGAAKRISAEVARRRASDPTFTTARLRAEMERGTRTVDTGGKDREGAVTLDDDIKAAATDVVASRKVSAEVNRRRASNPDFTVADLRRELKSGTSTITPTPDETTAAAVRSTGACSSLGCPCTSFVGARDVFSCGSPGCKHLRLLHRAAKKTTRAAEDRDVTPTASNVLPMPATADTARGKATNEATRGSLEWSISCLLANVGAGATRTLSPDVLAATAIIRRDRSSRWTPYGQCAPNRFLVAFTGRRLSEMQQAADEIRRGPEAMGEGPEAA